MNTQSIKTTRLGRGALVELGDRDHLPARNLHSISDFNEADEEDVGFQLAHKLNADRIVSDGMIPQVNGNALGKKLEDEPEAPRILVVLLTVRNLVEYRIEGILSGADDYIPVQPDLNHLKARIRNLVESVYGLKDEFARHQVSADTEFTVTPPDGLILAKAIKVVEEHMTDEDFSVDRFSQLMGMSRSALKRKLKALTGLSPQPFVQQLRLKRAARLLATGGISISETARMVGYYDLSHFGRVFKNHFECTPSHYGQKVQAGTPVDESAANEHSNPWPGYHFGPSPRSFGRCL